jgi:transcription antitermination factor NusG
LTDFPKWFAVLCGPRAEQEASVNLRRAGYPVFFPFVREVRRVTKPSKTRRERVVFEVPLFQRYVFFALRGPEQNFDAIRPRNAKAEPMRGISSIIKLPMSKVPLQIPNAAITLLMDWADKDGCCPSDRLPHWFKGLVGDHVEYTDGAFDKVIATIASLEPLESGDEIRIWLELLGHKVESTVPLATVKLMEARV